MTRYLISFDDGTMNLSDDEIGQAGIDAHAVMRDAQAEGVWIFGGGLLSQRATIVNPDGTVADGPFPETKAVLGGFSILELPTRQEAVKWAGRIAAACRCPQEVREIMYDAEV